MIAPSFNIMVLNFADGAEMYYAKFGFFYGYFGEGLKEALD